MINNVLNNKLQIINLTDTNMDIKISDVPGETSFASAMGEEAFKQFMGLEMTAYSGCRASFANEILNNTSIEDLTAFRDGYSGRIFDMPLAARELLQKIDLQNSENEQRFLNGIDKKLDEIAKKNLEYLKQYSELDILNNDNEIFLKSK